MQRTSVVLVALAGAISTAHGAFTVPDGTNYNWTRGTTANSASAQWDLFTTTSVNAPDVGEFSAPALTGWNVRDSSGGIVTTSRNILNEQAPLNIAVNIPNYNLGAGYATTVLLQVRSVGGLDNSSVKLDGAAFGSSSSAVVGNLQIPIPGGPVINVPILEYLFRWDVAGNVAAYTATFKSSTPQVSVDKIAVDTYASVPAPSAAGVLTLGGLLTSRRKR